MELETQNSSIVTETVATKDKFTPSSVLVAGIDLCKKNLNKFLQIVGYDLPDGYIEALCESLRVCVKPLILPVGERPYDYLMACEEKVYKVRPIDSKSRISIEEEIILDAINKDVPTIFLHSSDKFNQFEFEVILYPDPESDDKSWEFLDRIGKLSANLIPSQDKLVVRRINENGKNYTFVGEGISISFIKKDDLVFPKADPEIEYEEMWVPYNIQLCGASEAVEEELTKQLGSEKVDKFLQSGALGAIKGAISNPDEIPDLPLDLLKMVKNKDGDIRFSYNSEILVQSEDLYDESYDDEEIYSDYEDSEEESEAKFEVAGDFDDEEDYEYDSSLEDEESEIIDDGQQRTSSFLAEFNDSEIGVVSLCVGNCSFFDVIGEYEDGDILCRTGKVEERKVVEVFWDLLDVVSDKCSLEKYVSMAKKCAESIGVTNFDELVNGMDDSEVSSSNDNQKESEVLMGDFSIKVKSKKVRYPVA